MLYGKRAPIEGVRYWLKDPVRPLLLVGPTGTGKNFVLETLSAELGMQPETHEDPLVAMSNARHPTFYGKGRYALIDDADWLGSRLWTKVQNALPDAPPTAILALSIQSVPYQVRTKCVVIELERPQERHLQQMLADHPADAEVLDAIAKTARSWRQAKVCADLNMIPDGDGVAFVHQRDQPKALLSGEYNHDFTVHPLSILSMAHHNGTPPGQVAKGLMMHSHAWEIDNLSTVSRHFIRTLRAKRTDSPPYSKR